MSLDKTKIERNRQKNAMKPPGGKPLWKIASHPHPRWGVPRQKPVSHFEKKTISQPPPPFTNVSTTTKQWFACGTKIAAWCLRFIWCKMVPWPHLGRVIIKFLTRPSHTGMFPRRASGGKLSWRISPVRRYDTFGICSRKKIPGKQGGNRGRKNLCG